jgi:hypothetical protein
LFYSDQIIGLLVEEGLNPLAVFKKTPTDYRKPVHITDGDVDHMCKGSTYDVWCVNLRAWEVRASTICKYESVADRWVSSGVGAACLWTLFCRGTGELLNFAVGAWLRWVWNNEETTLPKLFHSKVRPDY